MVVSLVVYSYPEIIYIYLHPFLTVTLYYAKISFGSSLCRRDDCKHIEKSKKEIVGFVK